MLVVASRLPVETKRIQMKMLATSTDSSERTGSPANHGYDLSVNLRHKQEITEMKYSRVVFAFLLLPSVLCAQEKNKLETRIKNLEQQLALMQRRLAFLEAGLGRESVYEAMGLTGVTTKGGPFRVGDDVTVEFQVTNVSKNEIQVPPDRSYSRPLFVIGNRQLWIERAGSNKTIPGIPPRTRKSGNRYAAGGSLIASRPTFAPDSGQKVVAKLTTNGFPPGKYLCHVEYSKIRGKVLDSATVEFEIQK